MGKRLRWPRPAKERKMRQHCSTCGKAMAPTTWAYCSKECERLRPAVMSDEEDMPEEAVERFLELSARLDEKLSPDEEAEVRAEMAQLQQQTSDVAKHDRMSPPDPLPRTVAEFWIHSARQHEKRVESTMRKSMAAAVRLGDLLLDAKAALPHGQFGRLFRGHPDAVKNALKISRSWGNRLMAVARSPVLADPSRSDRLPGDVGSLYFLSWLSDDRIDAALEAGEIRSDMSRDEVREFVDGARGHAPRRERSDRAIVADLVNGMEARLRRFADAHPEVYPEAKARLIAVLTEDVKRAEVG